MKKLRLVSKKMGSGSLKRLQQALTEHEGYKVWRSRFPKAKRRNLLYGDGKDKITQYQFFQDAGLPALAFTTKHEEALSWVQEDLVNRQAFSIASIVQRIKENKQCAALSE